VALSTSHTPNSLITSADINAIAAATNSNTDLLEGEPDLRDTAITEAVSAEATRADSAIAAAQSAAETFATAAVAGEATARDAAIAEHLGGSFSEAVGDGTSTSFAVTHNLGTRDVTVQLYAAASPYGQVWATVTHDSAAAVTVQFATPPAAGAYRVVVQAG
jgi:hypothetical protein